MPYHGRISTLFECHCRRQQLDRQRQKFYWGGVQIVHDWMSFERCGVWPGLRPYDRIIIDSVEEEEVNAEQESMGISYNSALF